MFYFSEGVLPLDTDVPQQVSQEGDDHVSRKQDAKKFKNKVKDIYVGTTTVTDILDIYLKEKFPFE